MIILRIEKVKLNNFKQYKNFEIEFSKNDNQDNDFHVIVAIQGVGKSNLLESINWCLYGKEIFGKITKPTDQNVLNDNCKNEDNIYTVKVALNLSDENKNYLIIRDSKFKVAEKKSYSLNESQLSFSEKTGFILKNLDAKKEINNLLPEDLRDHFFFNGERLQNYFDKTQGEKISLVIKKMSGLDILESFNDILEKIENKYRKMIKVNDKNINLKKELEEELELIKTQKKEKENLLEKFYLNRDKAKKDLNEVNLKLDKLREYEHIKNQIDTLKGRLKELNNMKGNILKEKIQNVIEMGTLIFGWAAVERVYHENSNIDNNYDYLPHEIIKTALKENKCPVCEKELDENHKNILEKYLLLDKDFIISAKDYQELTNQVKESETKRKRLNNQLGEIEIKINGIKEELKSIEKNISQIQTNELNKLYDQKKRT